MGNPHLSIIEFPIAKSWTYYSGQRGAATLEVDTKTGHLRIVREEYADEDNIRVFPYHNPLLTKYSSIVFPNWRLLKGCFSSARMPK